MVCFHPGRLWVTGCRADGVSGTDGLPSIAEGRVLRKAIFRSTPTSGPTRAERARTVRANRRRFWGGVNGLGQNYSNAKMRFKSLFMLIMVQPFVFALSHSAWVQGADPGVGSIADQRLIDLRRIVQSGTLLRGQTCCNGAGKAVANRKRAFPRLTTRTLDQLCYPNLSHHTATRRCRRSHLDFC